MVINETIITGRKYRRLIDVATRLWERISFWTKASDVEFDDGESAQTKVGAIKGITTSTNVTETGYAIDASVIPTIYTQISELNNDIEKAISDAYKQGMNAANNADIGSITTCRNGGSVSNGWVCTSKLAIISVNAEGNCGNLEAGDYIIDNDGRVYLNIEVDGRIVDSASVWVYKDGHHDELKLSTSFSMTKGQKLKAGTSAPSDKSIWASLTGFSATAWLLD